MSLAAGDLVTPQFSLVRSDWSTCRRGIALIFISSSHELDRIPEMQVALVVDAIAGVTECAASATDIERVVSPL